MSTTSQFTERDVSEFFDRTTQTYLSFWDSEGVLHTGYFADEADTDYPAAADRTSDILAADAGIDATSRVLDVGCGCGNFLLRLAERTGCRGEGLDLSIERIRFAESRRAERAPTADITFRHGSATALPYADGSFSHVVSQDALFLVPEKPRSHAEMFRVLAPGGVLTISDFLQPRAEIGAAARRHVYDRVRWNGGYSLDGYADALTAAGFVDVDARSLDAHIRQTYRVLGHTARERAAGTADEAARTWILGFADSCDEIQAAIDRGEFGWGMVIARKPA
ncbi:class I SAM-dependent methyltransferase [Micromonospora auratinigra]|uniref:Methyltransferase domain-containing protein n=1 Tax=Micromonospora auratinigra TaxID=261654 RepID=A0A1A8Z988_9ACTN|nr:class I SAM-dependent methyltransferase [Micromonospora auratinigra]SBT40394.1 Methyltransferase domain-containing protein [Micromonospora auratinigra]